MFDGLAREDSEDAQFLGPFFGDHAAPLRDVEAGGHVRLGHGEIDVEDTRVMAMLGDPITGA